MTKTLVLCKRQQKSRLRAIKKSGQSRKNAIKKVGHSNVEQFKKAGKSSLVIAIFGIIVPLVLGTLSAFLFYGDLLQNNIITQEFFVPTILAVLLTTIATPILLKVAFTHKNEKQIDSLFKPATEKT